MRAHRLRQACNALLLKVNQIGTMTIADIAVGLCPGPSTPGGLGNCIQSFATVAWTRRAAA